MRQKAGETKEEFNARCNAFQKEKYFRRRAEAIEYLGGKCVDCGWFEMLEFDHKNPALKEYNIGALFSSASHEKLYKEVDKCELRCVACHAYKTASQKLEKVNVLMPL